MRLVHDLEIHQTRPKMELGNMFPQNRLVFLHIEPRGLYTLLVGSHTIVRRLGTLEAASA